MPVILSIAVYFCIADGILIGQCLYYKIKNTRASSHPRRRSSTETPDPTTPLLGRRFSDSLASGQGRRRSSGSLRGYQAPGRRESQVEDPLAKIVEENEYGRKAWVKNTLSVLGIFLVGAAGWTVAWRTGMWAPAPQEIPHAPDEATGGQILGYASAVLYLGYVLDGYAPYYADSVLIDI